MQVFVFWAAGVAFFAAQAGLLLRLLREARSGDREAARHARLEIVWTLVPASVIAALALMLGGLTRGSWTDREAPVAAATATSLRWAAPGRPVPAASQP